VGANRALRQRLSAHARLHRFSVFYPELEFCTDNGAMIALAGALRLQHAVRVPTPASRGFTVRPRWDLETLAAAVS
jgi:N6-L-threonylcarbamoyladenine synthase